jgi:riboflavin synthase
MFSGIVHHQALVADLQPVPTGRRLTLDPAGWSGRLKVGNSLAVNGCCLTVVSIDASNGHLTFDVIPQTLSLTTLGQLQNGDKVNIEPAVTASTLLNGHFVQGHIDGTGRITEIFADKPEPGGVWMTLEPPVHCMAHIVPQGSITVDGVSLTIAQRTDKTFSVALIPLTLQLTTLGSRRPGEMVNLETDILVKTIMQSIAHMDWSTLIGNHT